MTDTELLTKILTTGYTTTDTNHDGTPIALIDTSWFEITPDEETRINQILNENA